MRNKVGPPVEGDDFYGRQKELDFAFDLIQDGNSLLLASPRRVGKTSFAKKMLNTAKDSDWRTMELNLEKVSSEQQFVRFFVEEITKMSWWKNVSSTISNRISGIAEQLDISIEHEGIKGSISWSEKRKKVFDDLESLFEHSKNTLIMIDELGVLLTSYEKNGEEGIRNAEALLSWFRNLTQVSNTKIRWVFCSSIGIRNFTNRHNISYTINNLELYSLKTFDKETSEGMLKKLAESKKIELSNTVIDAILEKISWYLPYFIQLMFNQINYLTQVEEIPLNKNIVGIAYKKLVVSQYFDTWDERLSQYFELEIEARNILSKLSQSPNGEKRNFLFNLIHLTSKSTESTNKKLGMILRMLVNDGYLFQKESEEFVFRSPLLKDYWYLKFVK